MTPVNQPFDDAAIRDAFRALRREESERAPGFDTTLTRGRARQAKRRTRARGIVVVAVAAGALFVTARTIDRPAGTGGALAAELLASHGVWRGPTDFLLDDRRDPLWRSTVTLRETLSYMRIPQ